MERVFAYDTYLLDINSVESSAEALAIRDISQRTLLRLSQSRCPHRLRVATSLAGGLSASRVAPLDAGGAGDRCVARARARQADAERCASTAPMQPHTTQSPLHISRHRTHRTATTPTRVEGNQTQAAVFDFQPLRVERSRAWPTCRERETPPTPQTLHETNLASALGDCFPNPKASLTPAPPWGAWQGSSSCCAASGATRRGSPWPW
jgi:hypothetical protein